MFQCLDCVFCDRTDGLRNRCGVACEYKAFYDELRVAFSAILWLELPVQLDLLKEGYVG